MNAVRSESSPLLFHARQLRWWAMLLMIALAWGMPAAARQSQPERSEPLIRYGRYLTRVGDCKICHTAIHGKPFAGGRPIKTPFGVIYSTNITPDQATGIGGWTSEDFYRSMHAGMRPNGAYLFPAFPYPWYTKLTRYDVRAIQDYLNKQPAVHERNRTNGLAWPFRWRELQSIWRALFFREGVYQSDPAQTGLWNRGAYLVRGLAHCGGCHTPRNALGATEKNRMMQGAKYENWYAPDISSDKRLGLGSWRIHDIVNFLQTGRTDDKSTAFGPMADVVQRSTQYLSDRDARAIAVYLKSIAPKPAAVQSTGSTPSNGQMNRGKSVYLADCSICHRADGGGIENVFPPLQGSPVVLAPDPTTLIRLILNGGAAPATHKGKNGFAMSPYGDRLNDWQIADLSTYLRNAWSNDAPAVTAAQVKPSR